MGASAVSSPEESTSGRELYAASRRMGNPCGGFLAPPGPSDVYTVIASRSASLMIGEPPELFENAAQCLRAVTPVTGDRRTTQQVPRQARRGHRQVHDLDVTGMQGNPLLGSPSSGAQGAWLWRHLDDPGMPIYSPKEGAWGTYGKLTMISVLSTSTWPS